CACHCGGVRPPEPVPPIHGDDSHTPELSVGQEFNASLEPCTATDERVQPVENAEVETARGIGPHSGQPRTCSAPSKNRPTSHWQHIVEPDRATTRMQKRPARRRGHGARLGLFTLTK